MDYSLSSLLQRHRLSIESLSLHTFHLPSRLQSIALPRSLLHLLLSVFLQFVLLLKGVVTYSDVQAVAKTITVLLT